MRRITHFAVDFDGKEFELEYEACDPNDMLMAKVGDEYVIAYLVYDNDAGYRDLDDMIGDGMGTLYSFHRNHKASEHESGLEALGNNRHGEKNLSAVWNAHQDIAIERYLDRITPATIKDCLVEQLAAELRDCGYTQHDGEYDVPFIQRALALDAVNAYDWDRCLYEDEMLKVLSDMWDEPQYFPGNKDVQLLSCYQHGGESWSLSGSGMQCEWDTCNSAGVWVPDKTLREALDDAEAAGKDRAAQARKYCKQFLEMYNDIINGSVYGCCVQTFDEDGVALETDNCWGYIGMEHAEESMKSEFFEPTCARIQKAYDAQQIEETA